jgi:hypothetical protein
VAGAGVVLTIGASVTFFLWRKWQWREPLSVSYFVPQAVYAAQVFPGAPDTPEFPEHITVGVGTYCLIHHVAIKRPNVVVNGIQLEFHGPAKGRPRNRGITAPLLVRKFTNELGEESYEDWYGMTRPLRGVTRFPKHFSGKHDRWFPGHVIETTEPWKGRADVIIHWRNESGNEAGVSRTSLIFYVTDDPSHDRIFFLKRTETETSHPVVAP